MAWLIALALFWGTLLMFAKAKDAANGVHAQKVDERCQVIDTFLANVYILSWHYYQQLEPQVLQAWVEIPGGANRDAAIPETPAFSYFSKTVFDEEIHQKAITLAIQRLMDMQKIVMTQNPNTKERSSYSQRLVLSKYNEFDFNSDIMNLWLNELPKLGDFYFWHFASKAHDPEIQKLIPQESDPRVYQYMSPFIDFEKKVRWVAINRHGTPKEYEKSCRELPKRDYKIKD